MSPPRLLNGSALAAAACLLCTVFGQIPAPQNVRVDSVNLEHILRWDPPIYQGGNLTYTVQYIRSSCIRGFDDEDFDDKKTAGSQLSEFRDQCQRPMSATEESEDKSDVPCSFRSQCSRTVLTECVFHSLPYGSFCLRVRAEFENSTSAWESIYLEPLEHTTIGPPSDVIVKSREGFLDASFTCPMYKHENVCMENIYATLQYTVRYWKKGMASQAKTVNTKQTYAILSDLEPWTTYCLQVHGSAVAYSKTGLPSPVVCEKTSNDGHVPWWIKTLAFLLSLGAVVATVVGCFFISSCLYKVTRYVFYPPYSLPQLLKEFLDQSIYEAPVPAMKFNEEENELCNKVTVISEDSGNCSDNCASLGAYKAEESA